MNLRYYIKNPKQLFFRIGRASFLKGISDEKYIKMLWNSKMSYPLNLNNPKTFNEKMQWLKLNDRKDIYTSMADKYEVKKLVSDLIGEEYVIPTIGIWDRFEDIDFDSLPAQFVLKCTHDSGGLFICRDKTKFDIEVARKKIKRSLSQNYYLSSREWPYKNIKPRVLAEAYMQDGDNPVLNVYKIFNFNGKPKIIQAIQGDKTRNETIDYFDTEWRILDLKQNYNNSETPLPKPIQLSKMLQLAEKLSGGGYPFVRTDFYEVEGRVYFSEYTFYSDSGFAEFEPKNWDSVLGDMISL